MKIEKKTLDASRLELTITVDAEDMKAYVYQASVKISETTKIDGFRPGHVPYDVLRQRVGEMPIYEEAANVAINKTFLAAIKQEKVFFVGDPEIHVEKIAPGNDFMYRAILALLPTITLPDFNKVKKVEKKKIAITEKDVNKGLEELQKMHKKEVVKEGSIEKGDKIEVTFDISRDKVLIENGHYEKFPVLIGENMMIPGFEDAFIGLKKGEKKEFELTFPEKYHEKSLAGQKATFSAAVDSVFRVELPTLDDSFAQTLGKFQRLEELKTQIRDNLQLEAANREEQQHEQEIFETLLKETGFTDIPELLIRSEQDRILAEIKQHMTQQGAKWDDYLSHMKKTEEEMRGGYKNQAIERVKVALISREIAAQQKLTPTTQDIDAEVNQTLQMYEGNADVQQKIQSENYRQHIETMQTNRKVVEFLKKNI